MAISYTVTDNSISLYLNGKAYSFNENSPNFKALREALLKRDYDGIEELLTVKGALEKWAKGKFSLKGDAIYYGDDALPSEFANRIYAAVAAGDDPGAFFKFWERLQLNPSNRSVSQLWKFLEHSNIPLTPDGCFLAYKGVREDYTDQHTGKILNTPGTVVTMERNKISDDPTHACHVGLHVGAYEYASNFGPVTVVCKVDPQDVVCVPYDHDAQKMRVCKYTVLGNYGALLESTTTDEDVKIQQASGDSEFSDLDAMETRDLLTVTTERLRKYASHLKILGASKIVGGKAALVRTIIKVRNKSK